MRLSCIISVWRRENRPQTTDHRRSNSPRTPRPLPLPLPVQNLLALSLPPQGSRCYINRPQPCPLAVTTVIFSLHPSSPPRPWSPHQSLFNPPPPVRPPEQHHPASSSLLHQRHLDAFKARVISFEGVSAIVARNGSKQREARRLYRPRCAAA